jgi:hypothetical protein
MLTQQQCKQHLAFLAVQSTSASSMGPCCPSGHQPCLPCISGCLPGTAMSQALLCMHMPPGMPHKIATRAALVPGTGHTPSARHQPVVAATAHCLCNAMHTPMQCKLLAATALSGYSVTTGTSARLVPNSSGWHMPPPPHKAPSHPLPCNYHTQSHTPRLHYTTLPQPTPTAPQAHHHCPPSHSSLTNNFPYPAPPTHTQTPHAPPLTAAPCPPCAASPRPSRPRTAPPAGPSSWG